MKNGVRERKSGFAIGRAARPIGVQANENVKGEGAGEAAVELSRAVPRTPRKSEKVQQWREEDGRPGQAGVIGRKSKLRKGGENQRQSRASRRTDSKQFP